MGVIHGPGPQTPTNALGWSPRYPLPIRVRDDAFNVLPKGKRAWKWGRQHALDNWREAGIDFTLTVGTGTKYYAGLPWQSGDVAPYLIPSTIRLLLDAQTGRPDFAWYVNGAGLVVLSPFSAVTSYYHRRDVMGTLGHEIGHTLGLWHRADSGIMSGGLRPDAHDLDSIRNWNYQRD